LLKQRQISVWRYFFASNSLDQLIQVTAPRSLVASYADDGLSNLNSQVSPDTGTQFKSVAYAYVQDINGVWRLTGVAETAADDATVLQTTQCAYGQKGRLIQETRNLADRSFVTAYAYNQTNGRLADMTYPSGRTVACGYDALGQVSQVSSTAPPAQGANPAAGLQRDLPAYPPKGTCFGT